MKQIALRSLGLWLTLAILLVSPLLWAGAQGASGARFSSDSGAPFALPRAQVGSRAPASRHPDALLWDQPSSASNTDAYDDQDFEADLDDLDIFLADDFANDRTWQIDTIFVPGGTFPSECSIGCADAFTWQVYADGGGVPDGDPWGGGNPPVWQLTVPPTDDRVSISYGAEGWLSDVTLNLKAPLSLAPGTWWLVFYPGLDLDTCDCQYGRRVADTANGYPAQVINPGGGFGYPTAWTSIQDPATWQLTEQDLAFRLEGGGLLSLGDRVWYDTNRNGIQGPGEPGVAAIGVDLYGGGTCTGTPLASTATAASGLYGFYAEPGTYCLQFTGVPPGWSVSPKGQGGDAELDSDAEPTTRRITDIHLVADALHWDVGLYAEGSAGGLLWCDHDLSGLFDPGEGVAGVPVRLHADVDCNGVAEGLLTTEVSGADGRFLHDNLAVGPAGSPVCYVVRVAPADMGPCNQPLGSDHYAVALDLEQPNDLTGELGFFPRSLLGDWVWYDTDQDGIQDTAEPGVPGVSVALYDNAACTGSPVATASTDASGNYGFDLLPGSFCLQFYDVPEGWFISPPDQGFDEARDSDADPLLGQIRAIALSLDDLDQDLGLHATGSVGDLVWCDENYSGGYDPSEGVAGVPVQLFADANCDGEAGRLLGTEVTAGDGQYLHSGLAVGPAGEPVCYVVSIDPDDMGACHHPNTSSVAGAALDLDHPDDLNADFGFSKILVLGDRVWVDGDRNGLQDEGEPGMPNIAVDLHSNATCMGSPVQEETTDGEGLYHFYDLRTGSYCLQFHGIPQGWQISPRGKGDDRLDSDADPVTGRVTHITLEADDVDEDMGLYAEGTIAGTIFCDADRNGAYDLGEGLTGVLVRLYGDSSCPGMDGGLLGGRETVGDGHYLFSGLYVGTSDAPACYLVELDKDAQRLCGPPLAQLWRRVQLDGERTNDLNVNIGLKLGWPVYLPLVAKD